MKVREAKKSTGNFIKESNFSIKNVISLESFM